MNQQVNKTINFDYNIYQTQPTKVCLLIQQFWTIPTAAKTEIDWEFKFQYEALLKQS